MFHLPKELIIEIYEFDNTYRERFDLVLRELRAYLYCTKGLFYRKIPFKVLPSKIKGKYIKTYC